MLSLIAFSQKDTSIKVKTFPIPVVRQIMKDILSGDSAKVQLSLCEDELIETNKKLALKDSVINTLRLKEANYLTIIESEKEKFQIMGTYSKKLESDLKKEKVKNNFRSIVGGGLILALTFLLISK